MGCYQDGVAKDTVNGQDVTAHIFEYAYPALLSCNVIDFLQRYTSHVVVTDTGEVAPSACPVQIIFCLKEQNKKKLNRFVDMWFDRSYTLR